MALHTTSSMSCRTLRRNSSVLDCLAAVYCSQITVHSSQLTELQCDVHAESDVLHKVHDGEASSAQIHAEAAGVVDVFFFGHHFLDLFVAVAETEKAEVEVDGYFVCQLVAQSGYDFGEEFIGLAFVNVLV